ncbi:nephrin-like isoform X2 [Dreissena polymorpha]|uniref:nephrin-like isoform X2 n=1 Tax=Dreissena polymorpha TaxID=45954 RepID=UPI002264CF02|nr:nephrin-like isoform X2 [Dreissena polymorpha]
MILPDFIQVCAIYLVAIQRAESCMETYANSGDVNVQLIFDFHWNNIDKSTILCYKGRKNIGSCEFKFGNAFCFTDGEVSSIYNLSSKEDYTKVNINIALINNKTAGEYSCYTEKDVSQRTSICIHILANLTSLMLLPQANVTYPVYQEQSVFTCITSQSRPSARIHWFVAGRNITGMASYSNSSDVPTSILKYTPYSITGETLTCTAYYFFKSTNITIQRGTYMEIQYPVTKPVILINNSNVYETVLLREGTSAEFKCSASSYPLPSYRWVYPGGLSDMKTVIIKFNRTANGGTMTCIATNNYHSLDGTVQIKSTTFDTVITLNVTYPPFIVSIKDMDTRINVVDNIIRLLKGDSLRLLCESVANPPATTLWQGQHWHSNILTTRNIQFDTEWTCEAFNILDGLLETTNRTVHAEVLYGPAKMNITYNILPNISQTGTVLNDGNITVIEGSTVQLKCSDSSSPPSKYFWDNGLDGQILNISNLSRTTNTSYMCIATNIMETTLNGTVTGRKNITLQLHVLYGPRNMSAVFNNTFAINRVLCVLEGWSFVLSCFANSQPASKMSWTGITARDGGSYVFINSVHIGINKSVTCTGTNTMVDSLGNSISKSEHLTIELNVLYPPVVLPIENQHVVINMSLYVVCKLAKFGNPSDTNFTWNKLDSNRTFLNTGDIFKIDRAQLSDEGDYQCLATNTMHAIGNKTLQGSSKSQFFLDIQYGARVKQFYANTSNSRTIIIDQNQSIELICEVDGDPYPSVHIINATGEQQLKLNGSIASFKKITTRIHRLRCEYDAGRYKCATNNVHTSTLQEQNLSILIQCSPIASPFAPPVTTLRRALNDTAVLTFTIKAYPEPSVTNFTWFKGVSDGWDILSHDYKHYKISVSQDGLQTELTINNVQKDDFGTYRVDVSNTIGSVSEVFTLQAQTQPESPQEVNVVRRGITEIDLEWVPGFNGGLQQTFIINYTDTHFEIWNAVRVPVDRTTHTLRGLEPDTTYTVKMRAENIIGNSTWTDYITISTFAEIDDKGYVSKAIGGSIGGLTVTCIIVTVMIIFWRRKIKEQNTQKTCKYEDLGQYTKYGNTTEGSYASYNFDQLQVNTDGRLTELEMQEYLNIPHHVNLIHTRTLSDDNINASSIEQNKFGQEMEYVNLKLSSL